MSSLTSQLELLDLSPEPDDFGEVQAAPIFTESARQGVETLTTDPDEPTFSQYGLLAGDADVLSERSDDSTQAFRDPRVYQNIAAPSSAFICGSQGSGKSHTLSCMLENCLLPSVANVLPHPLTGLVLHYDTFTSNEGGSPCEAAHISSNAGVTTRVLCPPTNIRQIKRIYSAMPNVVVEELRINQTDLNTKRMLDLMAVSSLQGGSMPLYLHVVIRILRDLRVKQESLGHGFDYAAFKRAIDGEGLKDGQLAPLQQRLETLESFMVGKQTAAYDMLRAKGKPSSQSDRGNDWSATPGQLTIVDLSCPCVTPEMACSLFNICVSLFLEQKASVGRVIALDEAHKYMTDTSESMTLTESLLAIIRLQRHLGTRVIISTQEPTISPRLLDVCSVTVVHKFTSPDWLRTLQKHLAGAAIQLRGEGDDASAGQIVAKDKPNARLQEIFSMIIALRRGEALLFAPTAMTGLQNRPSMEQRKTSPSDRDDTEASTSGGRPVWLGHRMLKVRIRKRITTDGGKSILAT